MKSFSRKRSLGRKKYEIAIVGIHPDRQSHEISYCVVPAPAADGTITTVDILDKLRYAGPYHCLMLGNGEIVEKRLHADDCVKSVLVAIPPNAAIAACRTLALTVLADARVSEKLKRRGFDLSDWEEQQQIYTSSTDTFLDEAILDEAASDRNNPMDDSVSARKEYDSDGDDNDSSTSWWGWCCCCNRNKSNRRLRTGETNAPTEETPLIPNEPKLKNPPKDDTQAVLYNTAVLVLDAADRRFELVALQRDTRITTTVHSILQLLPQTVQDPSLQQLQFTGLTNCRSQLLLPSKTLPVADSPRASFFVALTPRLSASQGCKHARRIIQDAHIQETLRENGMDPTGW